MGKRWYDPVRGTFTTDDPAGDASPGGNATNYVAGSPMSAVDPNGTNVVTDVFSDMVGGTEEAWAFFESQFSTAADEAAHFLKWGEQLLEEGAEFIEVEPPEILEVAADDLGAAVVEAQPEIVEVAAAAAEVEGCVVLVTFGEVILPVVIVVGVAVAVAYVVYEASQPYTYTFPLDVPGGSVPAPARPAPGPRHPAGAPRPAPPTPVPSRPAPRALSSTSWTGASLVGSEILAHASPVDSGALQTWEFTDPSTAPSIRPPGEEAEVTEPGGMPRHVEMPDPETPAPADWRRPLGVMNNAEHASETSAASGEEEGAPGTGSDLKAEVENHANNSNNGLGVKKSANVAGADYRIGSEEGRLMAVSGKTSRRDAIDMPDGPRLFDPGARRSTRRPRFSRRWRGCSHRILPAQWTCTRNVRSAGTAGA